MPSDILSGVLDKLAEKKYVATVEDIAITPTFYRLSNKSDVEQLANLLADSNLQVHDTILAQLKELVVIKNPSKKLSPGEIEELVTAHLAGTPVQEYGVWVYYPWAKKLVHLLDEEEFIEVRTNRNLHKITRKDRDILRTKKIGVIGLSVGQTIAFTLVMERCCGELRISDFDTLDLSNYNRLRTGVQDIGEYKLHVSAREIAELDPFIKVVCYNEGINENNIDDFLCMGGKLDLLTEECDSLDIKILSRIKAKEYGIPVVMDTNDRGMIDIERFDINPSYPVLHGLMGEMDYHQLKGLTTEQKIPVMLKLVGFSTLSTGSKVSLLELGQSIVTWPQLASAVAVGGGIIADIARRILLNQLSVSGRFYIDGDALIKNEQPAPPSYTPPRLEELSLDDMRSMATGLEKGNVGYEPALETLKAIIADASTAPSSGNDQPWKWLYRKGKLFLFHDEKRSYSFGDYRNMASYISFGAAIENMVISAHKHGLEAAVNILPQEGNKKLIAKIEFNSGTSEGHEFDSLYDYIYARCTNRKIIMNDAAPADILRQLQQAAESLPGTNVVFKTAKPELQAIGGVISAVDRMRIMDPHGHYDFFNREMRWSHAQAVATRNGMDITTLEIPQQALLALQVLSDDNVMKVVRQIDGLQMFKMFSVPAAVSAAAMGLVTVPAYTPADFINGGRAIQRLWLKATQMGYALHPMIAPLYLFPRIIYGNGEGLDVAMADELSAVRSKFVQIFPDNGQKGELFLFRIFKAEGEPNRSLRLPLNDVLFID